ncbi:MAG: amidase domain-containing protein [Oscillospiraceae bacterium]|nr:amidase domain-containing protein [Oscillospiraceae bacterium]
MLKKAETLLVAVILLVCSVFCFADDAVSGDAGTLANGFDTLSYTQDDYLEMCGSSNLASDDEVIIENICKAYIASSRAYVRSPEEYSNEALTANIGDETMTSQLAYRQSEYDYLAALYPALDWEITEDSLEFDGFTVTVTDDTATASIVEKYTYYVTNDFECENYRSRKYTFSLRKSKGEWKIVGVTTDDSWETSESFVYEPIDVEASIIEATLLIESDEEQYAEQGIQPTSSTLLYKWTYDASLAVAYAEKYYNSTNSTFTYNTGKDCQNFASQCVAAGLGGKNTSKTAIPAVSTTLVGSSAANVWCNNQYSSYYPSSEYYYNWAWDNVCGFANLINNSSADREGPYGTTTYNGIINATVGDVLIVRWSGTPSMSTWEHAMFVTKVSGTAGSRSKSDVMIAAHTTDTNSAYETVASYTSVSVSQFGRCNIVCGFYSKVQS